MPDDAPEIEVHGDLSDAAIESLARLLLSLVDQEDLTVEEAERETLQAIAANLGGAA